MSNPNGHEDRQAFLVRLPRPLYNALKRYSTDTGIPMARLVSDAVGGLLEDRTGQEVRHGA